MNILIYHNCYFEISETFIYNQVKVLVENHRVVLVSHSIKNSKKFPLNLEVSQFVIPSLCKNIFERALHFIRRKISGKPYRLIPFSEKVLKRIIIENNIELIHVHFGNNALKILPLVRSLGIKMIVSFHGYDASRLLNQREYVDGLRELFSYANAVISCAQIMADRLLNYNLDFSISHVLNYGVDFNLMGKLKEKDKTEKITVLHAGRVTEKKGVPDLILVMAELFKKHPESQLKIIGEGEEYQRSIELSVQLGIERKIQFLGAMEHSELLNEMNSADIFVLNSRIDHLGNSEGFPNALLEAMSLGLAIVSTKHSGIPEIVDSGLNGILVEEKNNNQLLEAIDSLLNDENLRLKFGNEAAKKAKLNFGLNRMQEKLLEIVDSIRTNS